MARTHGWVLLTALLVGGVPALAQDDAEPTMAETPAAAPAVAAPAGELDALAAWARTPEAQRNRVAGNVLAPAIQADMLAVLGRGVSPCECMARRVRWAWALPLPHDRLHPAIVVAFVDPPRVQDTVLWHLRFAFLRFREGRYVVTSALALRRPALSMDAQLSVRLLPRSDVDDDDQLDIALRFQERWQATSTCGTATFASSAEQLTLVEEECGSEQPSDNDAVAYP